MAVPVDIFVKDESVIPVAMAGVEVGVFTPGSNVFVASATTDVNGLAAFMLPGSSTPGTTYEVRFFKLGVNFHGLRLIQVLEPATLLNRFDHTGADSNILPLSGSSRLCRCTGVFTDHRGIPMANKSIRFLARGNTIDRTPKVWDLPAKMVGTDFFEVMTDSNGRVSLNLIRNSHMLVSWGGDEDQVWCIHVPDRDSVNLIDLIHPFPAILDWSDSVAPLNAVSVQVKSFVEVPVTLTLTDYSVQTLELSKYVEFLNSDGTVVEASYADHRGVFVLTGLAPGTSTITPVLRELVPNRWPVPSVVLPTLFVTVIP